MLDLAYATASAMVAALVRKEVSAVELLEHHIARIERFDKGINAVVVRDFDRARASAVAADAASAHGDRRPLLGLPITVKESIGVAGLPATWGNPNFQGRQPDSDALSIARLKAAGAVIFGKTNVPFMLKDYQSYNQIYGVTNNPWDVTRTPGGSSGGSAAALAAGLTPLELGSDFAGSLRAPAHFCGVFAHKPSLDLIPMRGAGPPHAPAWPYRGDLAVCGPMARSASDLMLALEILAGPDERGDGVGYRLTLPPARHTRLKDFRILLLDEHPLYPTAISVRAALDRLAQRLAACGCRVSRSSPHAPDLAAVALNVMYMRAASLAADVSAADYEAMQATARPGFAEETSSLHGAWTRGMASTHRDWVEQSRERQRLRLQWQALMKEFDIVLCPAMPTPAFPHDHRPFATRRLDIDGRQYAYSDQSVWTGMATLFDSPATVAPIDRSETGLPIGLQIIGPYLEDRTTITFAAWIEREFGGFAPPGLDARAEINGHSESS